MKTNLHKLEFVDGVPTMVPVEIPAGEAILNGYQTLGVPTIFVANAPQDDDTCMVQHQPVPRDANGKLAFVAKGSTEEDSIAIWQLEQELARQKADFDEMMQMCIKRGGWYLNEQDKVKKLEQELATYRVVEYGREREAGIPPEETTAAKREKAEALEEADEKEFDYLPAKGIYLWEKLFGRMYTRVFLSDDVAKMFLDRLGKEKTTNKSFYLIEKDSEGNRVYLNNDDRYSLVTVAKADEKQEWFEYPITIKGMGHANSPFEEDQLLGKAESYEQLEDLECMLMSKYPDVHGVKVFGGKRDHVEAYGGITDLGEIVKNVRRVIGRGTR